MMDDHTEIVVCGCGAPVRIRELHFALEGEQQLDWAPCPFCYRKLYQMRVEGVVLAELVSELEWD
ncbi:hypothetical protein [Cupriavidus campinensis]|uniref:hypothetical protein n=1 Tax=Cupriavidus campinensis TaxID=151783 RepID=UPI0021CCF7FE|nr:hypothetical protein [Cupriavidus campinensis]